MAHRLRLTRRMPYPVSETAFRRIRRFAREAGLSEGEALSFIFENFDSVMNEDTFSQRLKLWKAEAGL